MKLFSLLFILLFGSNAFSMRLGTYECEGFDGESYSYGLILESDRLEIHLDMSTPNDVFWLGRRSEPYRVKLLSQQDIAGGVELMEYKYYQESSDSLRLTSLTHFFDGVMRLDATITQINDNEIEMYVVDSSGREEIEYIDYCIFQGQF